MHDLNAYLTISSQMQSVIVGCHQVGHKTNDTETWGCTMKQT